MTVGHVPPSGNDLACVGRTRLSVAFPKTGCPRSVAPFETWALSVSQMSVVDGLPSQG